MKHSMRRKSIRHQIYFDCHYIYNNKYSKCHVINISEHGAMIKIPQVLIKGDKIKIILCDDIKIHAIVRQHRANYISVQFEHEINLKPILKKHKR